MFPPAVTGESGLLSAAMGTRLSGDDEDLGFPLDK